MSPIIPKNTVIPTTKELPYTTVEDFQTTVTFGIFEGERPLVKNNHKLGKITISGIPPVKAGVPQLLVKFDVDRNGILQVSVKDTATGGSKSVKIANDKGRLNEAQIERMLRDAEKYAEDDRRTKERMDALESLQNYIKSMRDAMDGKNFKEKISKEDRELVLESLKDASQWIEGTGGLQAEEFKEKQQELEKICAPIVGQVYGNKGGGGSREDDDSYDSENDEEDGEL